MVAFKEEFPCLRCESGQIFEFDRAWLQAAITAAADRAGYPSWWLTEHVTESIAFYLRLRSDEPVVAFTQFSHTVRYVLQVIGYHEIGPYFDPTPPPILISFVEIAELAGTGYELAFFDLLEKRIATLAENEVSGLHFSMLAPCVKRLCRTKTWTRACDGLRTEIVEFVRSKLAAASPLRELTCSIR